MALVFRPGRRPRGSRPGRSPPPERGRRSREGGWPSAGPRGHRLRTRRQQPSAHFRVAAGDPGRFGPGLARERTRRNGREDDAPDRTWRPYPMSHRDGADSSVSSHGPPLGGVLFRCARNRDETRTRTSSGAALMVRLPAARDRDRGPIGGRDRSPWGEGRVARGPGRLVREVSRADCGHLASVGRGRPTWIADIEPWAFPALRAPRSRRDPARPTEWTRPAAWGGPRPPGRPARSG